MNRESIGLTSSWIETLLVGLMRSFLVAGLVALVGCGESHKVGDKPLDPVVQPAASADRPSAEMTGSGTKGDQQVTAFPGVKLQSAGDPVACGPNS